MLLGLKLFLSKKESPYWFLFILKFILWIWNPTFSPQCILFGYLRETVQGLFWVLYIEEQTWLSPWWGRHQKCEEQRDWLITHPHPRLHSKLEWSPGSWCLEPMPMLLVLLKERWDLPWAFGAWRCLPYWNYWNDLRIKVPSMFYKILILLNFISLIKWTFSYLLRIWSSASLSFWANNTISFACLPPILLHDWSTWK